MHLDVNRGSYEPLDQEIRKEYSSLLTGIAFCWKTWEKRAPVLTENLVWPVAAPA